MAVEGDSALHKPNSPVIHVPEFASLLARSKTCNFASVKNILQLLI